MQMRSDVSRAERRLPESVKFLGFVSLSEDKTKSAEHVELQVLAHQGAWSNGECFVLHRDIFHRIYQDQKVAGCVAAVIGGRETRQLQMR